MPRLGILSDSHGRVEVTARAVRALLDAGAEILIHLGDVETEDVIDELAGYDARLVLGNCDWNPERLVRHARAMGIRVDDPSGRIEVGATRVVYTHGHVPSVLEAAVSEGVEYLLHGHTHALRDERIGRTRVINPGALFRAPRYTVAVLDPGRDDLEILEVPRNP